MPRERNRVFRFYLGNSHTSRKAVADAVAHVFPSATVYQGLGVWLNGRMTAYMVEIIGNEHDISDGYAEQLARSLKYRFKQDRVIWTVSEVTTNEV